MKPQVICVPGGVAPAAQRYRPLIEAVGDAADLHLKDLEVYRGAKPSADYSIEVELEAIDRLADSKNLQRFHLLGYSGGGFISLAYAGTRPERLESLALFEPASIPGRLSEAEQRETSAFYARLSGLEGPEFMSAFVREQLKPGVAPPAPPSGPPSPEMQKRPTGIAALMKAFAARARDWLDIEGIIIRQTERLNWSYVIAQLKPLAELKNAPEIVDELEKRRVEFDK